jgi:hypothetical protein
LRYSKPAWRWLRAPRALHPGRHNCFVLHAGYDTLRSENMRNDGQVINGAMHIVNPFRSA